MEGGALIRVKRVYEKPSTEDDSRVLVERLWPRSLSKRSAALDLWLRDVAPSPELRKWFSHDTAEWEKFRERYWAELEQKRDMINLLRQKDEKGTVTLVYAARDESHNSAVALKMFLEHPKE